MRALSRCFRSYKCLPVRQLSLRQCATKPGFICKNHLAAVCFDLARRSGSLISEIFATGHLGVVDKGDSACFDPQSEADRRAQHLIVNGLRSQFPGLRVVGEEPDENTVSQTDSDSLSDSHSIANTLYSDRKACISQMAEAFCGENKMEQLLDDSSLPLADLTVWVDPLDGTNEYIEGIHSAVTCLIGVALGSQPIIGVINRPFTAQTVVGIPRVDCYSRQSLSSLPLADTSSTPMPALVATTCPEQMELFRDRKRQQSQYMSAKVVSECCYQFTLDTSHWRRILCTTRSHWDKDMEYYMKSLSPDSVLRVGGCGSKILMLMEGAADAYVYPRKGTKKWDTCATVAVLQAFDGLLTERDGVTVIDHSFAGSVHNDNGVLATWLPSHAFHRSFAK